MLSPMFWLGFAAVFVGMRFIAGGLISLLEVDLRTIRREEAAVVVETPALDKAA